MENWQGLVFKNVTISPAPTTYGVGVMDLDAKSERVASGLMFRDRIAVKRKLTLKWDEVTQSQARAIMQAVKGVFVEVEYDDLEDGARRTGTFYAGDRTATAMDYVDGEIVWENFAFNLTEQ